MANRGAWTPEEDHRLAQVIDTQGPKRWKSVAVKAGLNRCGKSCRLRWMNYLRPNIKRGNISAQEEDLILRLHKLLGNRWSLIAGRLPGRTDNEIKNYWNSHLSKKAKQSQLKKNNTKHNNTPASTTATNTSAESEKPCNNKTESGMVKDEEASNAAAAAGSNSNALFRTTEKDCGGTINNNGADGLNLDWISQFLVDMDDQSWLLNFT